eukprot:69709_1
MSQCKHIFTECESSQKIQIILKKYHKIIMDNTNDNNQFTQLQNIGSLFDDEYSHLCLLNDFYHVKYNHFVNDDARNFNSFFTFLTNDNDLTKCNCENINRYYRHRDIHPVLNNSENVLCNDYSSNLLSRIHTYFLHSLETSILTLDEIMYIEQQLKQYEDENNIESNENEILNDKKLELISTIITNKRNSLSINMIRDHSKYITADSECLDAKTMSIALNNYGIFADKNVLESVFDEYDYDKNQLINDLCLGFHSEDISHLLLTNILSEKLNHKQYEEQQKIYDVLLHEYIKKEEITHQNFANILSNIIPIQITNANLTECLEIVKANKLSCKMFNKKTIEFRTSVKFAKLFKSTANYKKKDWTSIYISINKWKTETEKRQQQEIIAEQSNYAYQINVMPNIDEHKYDHEELKYPEIEYEDNDNSLHSFCSITQSDDDTAVVFLSETNWNIELAVNRYYACCGDTAKLLEYSTNVYDKKTDANESFNMVYNQGISFWYWEHTNIYNKKVTFVEKKYDNLKLELLNQKISCEQWNSLSNECQIYQYDIQTTRHDILLIHYECSFYVHQINSDFSHHVHHYTVNIYNLISIQIIIVIFICNTPLLLVYNKFGWKRKMYYRAN